MTLLKAIHEIVRGDAKNREVIAPGKPFKAKADEAERLVAIGAALKMSDTVEASTEQPVPSVSLQQGEGEGEGEGADKSLGDMTKAELVAYAEARNIEVDVNATKAVIQAAIEAAEDEEII